jgi:acyl-coenzyme A synthetase/AMP-(fatty) acid ligase
MPGIADCPVFGVPHAEFGQSLVAVTILFRAALPREDTGKIFKRRLRDEFLTSSADAGHQ